MIRAAIVPIVGQRGRKALLATCAGTGAACLAAPLCRPTEYAQCAQSETSPDVTLVTSKTPSYSSLIGDVEQCASLVLPTMEALLRAARLAKTAATMAVDYQAYYYQRKHPDSIYSQLYSWAFLGSNASNGNEHDRTHKELEATIEQLERDLNRAQLEYVSPQPTKDKDSKTAATISERTLAKCEQKEAMMAIASDLATAQEQLSSLANDSGDELSTSGLHQRNALRLLDLCRTNGGVYIKVGQHLAQLDLLLPEEYIHELASLFDSAPVSTYQDVCKVIMEELGASPQELFDNFSEEPIASASLAQVHTAICKETEKKLAIKVQHKGLRETSKGDLFAMSAVVGVADKLFEEFKFGWIVEELTPQLPKELDFNTEGSNAEAAAAHLSHTGLDCVVPKVLWNFTRHRVLAMEFEEGFRSTDVESIDKASICRRDVAKLISSVFNSQMFEDGFVHCDPHPANVLLREHPEKKGKPQLVLVDHGLYKRLDRDFQEAYARLWRGIVMANIPEIQSSCEKLGVHKMYPLLAAMLTARPFDEVVERSQTRSLDASPAGSGDEAVIRGYAQRYLKEIVQMLDIVPRQMLLVFKMNDCLRHLDLKLGSPVNNLVVAGKYASKRVYEIESKGRGFFGILLSWLSYVNVLLRVNSYELFTRLR